MKIFRGWRLTTKIMKLNQPRKFLRIYVCVYTVYMCCVFKFDMWFYKAIWCCIFLKILCICYTFNRQTCAANLEQQAATLKELQERFRKVANDKKIKERELQKASTELEDAVSKLAESGTQLVLLMSVIRHQTYVIYS